MSPRHDRRTRDPDPTCPRGDGGSARSTTSERGEELVITWVTYRKYQFMELNLQRRMTGLKEKIPDIQKTLDSVKFLKLRKVRPARTSHPASY